MPIEMVRTNLQMNLQMGRDPSTAAAGRPLSIWRAILSGANRAVTSNRSSKHLVKLPRKIATLQSWGPVIPWVGLFRITRTIGILVLHDLIRVCFL